MTAMQDAVREGLEVLQQLIRINTTAGAGLESKAALWLFQRAKNRGWQAEVVEPEKGFGSLVVTFKGGSDDALLLLSHLDTAEPGSIGDWSRHPLSGEAAEGYIWGRGAVDCKGLAAVWWSVMLLLEKAPLARTVVWAATAGEETRSAWGTRWLRDHCPELRRCRWVLNEGGGWEIRLGRTRYTLCQVGEKGYARLLLPASSVNACEHFRMNGGLPEPYRAFLRMAGGLAGHVAAHQGSTAAQWLTRWLQRSSPHTLDSYEMFYHLFQIRPSAEFPGRFELICHALPGDPIEHTLSRGLRKLGLTSHEGCDMLELVPPTLSPTDDPLYEAIRRTHDLPVLPVITPGRSDSYWFRATGIPVYGWFPRIEAADLMRMHQPDERISVAAFTEAVECLYRLISRFVTANTEIQ
ncbi:M20/M25/M40 family metallo-hydrolase [Paenibacillus allorhizosphaerae]|uniref:Succinyl-diaminopimelate desuccinylase n=1 Tax=Paenibacillus allorhizosphaerae TaxID=2849866 RepID=A0ABM8VC03_9BACL|nr:M20/M25/M40 family metallo-hydrolase [Paenibacillus allorhizosphaerae]CAG7622595.1 Succinyl-diaminopimelate desuccinylase [Paenibacillus allorhizosphaerae]